MLYTSLQSIKDKTGIQQRLVGGCFDGEYFNKSVHLTMMTSTRQDPRNPRKPVEAFMELNKEQQDWYSFDWDKAHILELAAANAATKSKVFAHADTAIHQITKDFRLGKSYTQAESQAEEDDVRFYAPLQRSETRFARFQHRVLQNFQRNYATYYKILNANQDNSLAKIENAKFVLELTCESDILHRISQLSETLQRVGLNSWRMYDAIDDMFQDLEEMSTSLKSTDGQFHPKMEKLTEAFTSLRDSSTYQGIPIFTSVTAINKTRKAGVEAEASQLQTHLVTIQKKLDIYVKTLKSTFDGRANPNKAYVYPLVEESFRLENVLVRAESDTIPDQFISYFNLSKKVGYLPEDIQEDDIRKQYLSFIQDVKNRYERQRKVTPLSSIRSLEEAVYDQIVTSQVETNYSDVTDLLLSALSRAHCEGVCESMGSIIKDVADERSFRFQNMQEEMFISYNGPKPWEASTNRLTEDSLDRHFGKRPWHFYKKTGKKSLKDLYGVSLVVARKKKEAKESLKLHYTGSDRFKRPKKK